jgi:hypothetical protein
MSVITSEQTYSTFAAFYPRYVELHQNQLNRRCHFLGLVSGLALVVAFVVTGRVGCLAAAPLIGYGLSWLGHVLFEGNVPATKQNPLWSILGSFAMARDMLLGRLPF